MAMMPEGKQPRTLRPRSRELAKALELVRAWGAQGGKKRAQHLTAKERRESARKAAQARWKKKR